MSGSLSSNHETELPDAVEDALAEALLRSPAERGQRLAQLIAAHPDCAAVVRARVAEFDDAADSEGQAGRTLGHYTLQQQIAEGGMGSVWLAEQREPIQRRVAVKLIKLGMDTRQVMARFSAERQALAMMDHPNIAKVFDAGSTPEGRPFFVMEYIDGTPLVELCEREKIATATRLQLFLDVCSAIQHAHQKGVIHRDIKPSNVLVARHGEALVPKVIDFGIAKATGDALTDRTLFTASRQVVGTPAYMSPEQAAMSGRDIDTRSDIYALGVLLYELLTGTTPFDNRALLTKGVVEMVRTIREVEPEKPSTRVAALGDTAAAIAAGRRVDLARLRSQLRGDLDWIVMRCLEKDRARRYASASDLAADLRRHLADQPVLAGPPGTGYRLRKFVRRNRGRVIAGCLVVATLIVGLVVSAFGWSWALREKELADLARQEEVIARTHAELLVKFMRDTLSGIGPSVAKGRDVTMLREMMDRAADRIAAGELDDTPEAKIGLCRTIGNIYRELAAYEGAEAMLEPALALARSTYDGDHIEIAAAADNLGALHYVRGNLAAAEPLYREALAMVERLTDGDDRRVAGAQGSLAVLLQARGEFEEAERLYRRALAINQRLDAGDHSRTAWTMQALATLLSVTGRANEAEPFYRESLAMNQRLFPGDGPRVATGLGHLAILLHGRGDFEGAERYYRDSLAMNRRLYPQDHPSVATGLNALAMLLGERGAHAEATELFVESMAMKQRLFPGDQPNRAVDLDALASLYRKQRDLAAAIPLFEEALAARVVKLGPDHVDTLATMASLALSYDETGRHGDALPLLEQAGTAYLARGAWAAAEPVLRAAWEQRGGRSPSDWRAERSRARLGRALLGLGRRDEGGAMLVAAFAGLRAQEADIPVGERSVLAQVEGWCRSHEESAKR